MPEKNKSPLSSMKATFWSLTHWLTDGRTREGFDMLVANMPSNWAIEGQIEQGRSEDGRVHCQMLLKTPQTRGTRIGKFFPSTHIEAGRKFFALKNYVHKEETRVEEFKTVENRSPQWHVVRDRFYEWYVTEHADQLTFNVDDEEKLKYWDIFIGISLEEGMNVDVLGVNPQYRSCIMRYWTNMVRRTLSKNPPTSVDKCLDKTKAAALPGSAKGSEAAGGGYIDSLEIPTYSPLL